MQTDLRKLILSIFRAIIFLMIPGCISTGRLDVQPSVTMNSTPIFAPTAHESEQTSTSANTLVTSTPSSSPYSTDSFLPTSTIILAPTWTPGPKLSQEDARALVNNLLENNSGCKLPCWWGMVPGLTDWNTARHFLETFVLEIEQGGEGQKTIDAVPVNSTNYGVRYEGKDGMRGGFLIGVENGTIIGIVSGWDRNQKNFRIHQLLTDYGQPDEAFVKTYRYTSSGDPPPFHILLNYKNMSFWADYELEGIFFEDKVRGCPQSVNPTLWLWSPDKTWRQENMIREVYGPPVPNAPEYPPLTLKEATGMDLDTFTTIFKDSNNQSCLETPAKLWH